MPFVDIIYEKADDETKKNLKLVSKAFWECHVKEKFEKNFAKSQEKRHWQLYCYGDCPETDNFEVRFILFFEITIKFKACFKPPLYTTNRGEICPADEPRTRDGWFINSPHAVNAAWTKPEPSQQIKKWTGCRQCWEKFCAENPEYKICL